MINEKLIKWLKGNSDKHKMRKGIDDLVRENLDYFYPPSKEKTDYGEMLSTSLLGSGGSRHRTAKSGISKLI